MNKAAERRVKRRMKMRVKRRVKRWARVVLALPLAFAYRWATSAYRGYRFRPPPCLGHRRLGHRDRLSARRSGRCGRGGKQGRRAGDRR